MCYVTLKRIHTGPPTIATAAFQIYGPKWSKKHSPRVIPGLKSSSPFSGAKPSQLFLSSRHLPCGLCRPVDPASGITNALDGILRIEAVPFHPKSLGAQTHLKRPRLESSNRYYGQVLESRLTILARKRRESDLSPEPRPIFINENRQILLFKHSNLFFDHPFCSGAIG